MRGAMLVCALAVCISGCSDEGPWDGPAGTKIGITKAQIEKFAVLERGGANQSGATLYTSKQAPSMTAQADSYEYVFSGQDKLCLVQMRFDHLKGTSSPLMQQLKEQYGIPVKDEKVEWGVVWSSEKYKLGNDLTEVSSEFFGQEPNVSAVVSFTYANIKECGNK